MKIKKLILGTGTNQGNKQKNLLNALESLSKIFHFYAKSQIYISKAVDYTDQPDFFNQVLEFNIDETLNPNQVIDLILEIERKLGRVRKIKKGPRIIDIDILFWGIDHFRSDKVMIPHPRLFERSFVVLPLQELPYFQTLQKSFSFQHHFPAPAKPIKIQNLLSNDESI